MVRPFATKLAIHRTIQGWIYELRTSGTKAKEVLAFFDAQVLNSHALSNQI
jgi:hypothetical protein